MRAVIALVGSLAFVFSAFGQDGTTETDPRKDPMRGFAVVELFTSEGCHSCPPADVVAGQYAELARDEGLAIYVLGYHVDYWDRLGWKDPFSMEQATRRQQYYAARWGARRIYTPQMVVNGSSEFVGSDRARAREEIRSALERRPDWGVDLDVSVVDSGGGELVDIAVALVGDSALPEGVRLTVALVERGLETEVLRGENRGKSLKHADTVRAVKEVAFDDADPVTVELEVPEGVDLEDASIIVYGRDRSFEVLFAGGQDLEDPES